MTATLAALVVSPAAIGLLVLGALIIIFAIVQIATRYKRCPSNRILVIYGKVAGEKAMETHHGGGAYVWPIIQDYAYLSLEPLTVEIELACASSQRDVRVIADSTFTVGISTEPDLMNKAAERLLGLAEREIISQARDIICGPMRRVLATFTLEEMNTDGERLFDRVSEKVNADLNKIGLYIINIDVRDITEERGEAKALGQKAVSQ